ncbi:MAG: AAA family ATPase [Desulfurococcales archaeon]|nr:AAA family ATPase [Desulfurococcales archaeon]
MFISSIQIENLRGIKKGEIKGLDKVNILLGPNGAGKSTILEAIYLISAWARRIDDLRGVNKENYVVSRRTGRGNWSTARKILWHNMDTEKEIRICITTNDRLLDFIIPYYLPFVDFKSQSAVFIRMPKEILKKTSSNWLPRVYIASTLSIYDPTLKMYKGSLSEELRLLFNKFYNNIIKALEKTIFIDSMFLRNPKLLEERLWSKLLAKRLDKEIIRMIREGYEPHAEDLTYAPLYPNMYTLFLKLPHTSISIDVLGDGARNAIGLTAPLLLAKDTIVLLEDPEIHQHPGGIGVLMRFILNMVKKNNIQLIMSTQSIEYVRITLRLCKDLSISAKTFYIERENGELHVRMLKELDVDTLMKLGIDPRFLGAF